jgi:tetratricopeptide (TPR) repeat protein
MKRLFTNTISALLISLAAPVWGFQSDTHAFTTLEAGNATRANVPEAVYLLGQGDYNAALQAAHRDDPESQEWLTNYLYDLTTVTKDLQRFESKNFILFVPPDQAFLASYALPSLEKSADYLASAFGSRPTEKIRVEIYPTTEDFSKASTLSMETLKRSGAIGICKFHRLMIVSPQALPMGFRWLDALSHEYLHLNINELSDSQAELWLHEGTARYFETAYRLTPPDYLTPHQQTQLLEALDKNELVPFAKMSPSMVYLKDQDQVSLAFAQVAHAVSVLIRENSEKKFVLFLRDLAKTPFPEAFQKNFKMTVPAFEEKLKTVLAKEKWERTRGTLSDEVRFAGLNEADVIGADVQGRVRLGDRFRLRQNYEAALIEYNKALADEPDNAVILLKAAKTYLALGKKDKAIESLRRAAKTNPNYETPHMELALLVDSDEAMAHLMEAIAINPFDPRIQPRIEELKAKR